MSEPAMPLEGVFGYERPDEVLDSWTFEPGRFNRAGPADSIEVDTTSVQGD